MSTLTDQRWRVPRTLDLRMRRFDGEFVIYSAWSGDTHVLNALAGEALLVLRDAAHDASSLAAAVAAEARVELDRDFVQQMANLLTEFRHLGLIEPAPA